jgi:hypothetical protein
MRASAAVLAALLLAACSGGGNGETVVRRSEPPPPPVRADPVARYAYVLVPEYARLHEAFVAWLIPCVYIKEHDVCIERNAALAAAARRVLARLEPPPPRLRHADGLLRRGLANLARAADRQRRLLVAGDETGYLNSFSAFVREALPDVTNGIGELRVLVPGIDLPLLAGVSSAEARAELRSP